MNNPNSLDAVRESIGSKTFELIQSAPLGCLVYEWTHEDALILRHVNPAGIKILGVDTQPLLGKTLEEAFPPLAQTAIPRLYREVAHTGTPCVLHNTQYEFQGIRGIYSVFGIRLMEHYIAIVFYDISDRQRAEQERDLLFNLSLDMLCVATFDGRFRQVNPAWTQALGWTPEEMIRSHWIDFVHPEDREATILATQALMMGKPVLDFENRYRCKNGTYRWISWNSYPLVRESLIFAVSRDITERKHADQQLHVFKTLADNATDGIVLTTPDGAIAFANGTYHQLLGYNAQQQELLGQPVALTCPVEDRPRMEDEILPRGMDQGWSGEIRQQRRDGSHFPALASFFPLKDEHGALVYEVCMLRDISQRKADELVLAQNAAELRLLLDNMRDVVSRHLPDGTILFITPACRQVFGCEPAEMIGTKATDYVHPEDMARAWEIMRGAMSERQETFQIEERMHHKSGAWTWCETLGRVVYDMQGNAVEIQCTVRNISKRKEAEDQRLEMERQMLKSQKLESLGILAGGIAHDFNNLLTTILGNLDMALLDLPPLSPVRENLNDAINAARHAAELTRQMLTYSGRARFRLKAVDLSALVNEIGQLLAASVSKSASLRFHLASSLPLVMADPAQTQQVIMILAVNASEAIGDKPGTITISTGTQHCDAEYLSQSRLEEKPSPGEYAFLEVADTGCGMDADTQQRLFEPFFTTKFTGRGLGMAAVMGIMQGHKGAIFVSSEPGKGATIKVLLPVVPRSMNGPPLNEAKPPATRRYPWASGLVLLAEDEVQLRRLAQRMLERLGFSVITAADGEEAVRLFREHSHQIRCVLLDLNMPKLDGEKVHHELGQIEPSVKVILSTGYNVLDVVQQFAGKGLAGFVQKPYTMDNLTAVMESVLKEEPPSR